MAVDAIEIAVFLKQRYRGLLTDPPHSGYVVAGVADQRFQVHQLGWIEAVFFPNFLWPVVDGLGELLACQSDDDILGGELQQIAVPGQNEHLHALLASDPSDGAQDIIGLVSVGFQGGDAKRIDDLADALDLQAQVIRHLFTSAFVVGEQVVAKRAAGIEGHSQVLWRLLFQQPEDHRGEAIRAGGWFAGGGHPAGGVSAPGQCVVGPVGQGVAVNEVQARGRAHLGGPTTRGASQKAQSWLEGPFAKTASTNSTDLPASGERSRSSDWRLPS